MEIIMRSTQKHYDIKDITENEMLILNCFVNWQDEFLAKEVMRQKGEWEHALSDKEAIEIAIKLRDRIRKAREV